MYYYFSSDFPAVIKLNGIYYGQITNSVKHLDIQSEEPAFVEICSLIQTEKGINFILDDNFLSSPPDFVSVTDLKGGYLIKFNRSYNVDGFSVIQQEKFPDVIATVFCENGYKLSIETPEDFYAETLYTEIKSANIERIEMQGERLIVVRIIAEKQIVYVYKTSVKTQKIFFTECDDVVFNNNLTVVESRADIAKHNITSVWELSNGEFKLCSRTANRKEGFDLSQLHQRILPFAFAEELLAGGKVLDFLAENMQKNADKLKGFLGEFIGVMPPPTFREQNEVGLIYKQSDRKYFVRYFIFEMENNKILNIKEI